MTLCSVLEADQNIDVSPHRRATSWADVLADADVDAVSLCVPPGGRADLAAEALRAGKSVLLEKPPVMSVGELDDLVAISNGIGVMLQHRFRIPENVLSVWDGDSTGSLLVSRPRGFAHFNGWRSTSESALGGITAHLGIHYIDIACQLLGDVESVEINDYRECAPGIDVRTAGTIFFASGATLAFSVAADVDTRAEHLIIVGGDGRRFEISDGVVRARSGDEVAETPAEPVAALRERVYREFAAGPDRCRLDRTRAAVSVLDGVRKAGQ